MTTVFMIDGGAGRVIASIPALLKYDRLNPNTEWYICVHGWGDLYYGIPGLQERVYHLDQKNVFKDVFLKAKRVVRPEPYLIPDYYTQKISLAQAFDREINSTDKHADLTPPVLNVSPQERAGVLNILEPHARQSGNKPFIVIQPYGSTALRTPVGVDDGSYRSLPTQFYYDIIKELSKDYNLIYFGDVNLEPPDVPTIKPTLNLRQWAAVIQMSDYFIGCDSVGQHMARALDKPGSVLLGSTFAENISYPGYFNIIQKFKPTYAPLRLSATDSFISDFSNSNVWDYTQDDVKHVIEGIKTDIIKKVKNGKPNTNNGTTGCGQDLSCKAHSKTTPEFKENSKLA